MRAQVHPPTWRMRQPLGRRQQPTQNLGMYKALDFIGIWTQQALLCPKFFADHIPLLLSPTLLNFCTMSYFHDISVYLNKHDTVTDKVSLTKRLL